MHWYVRLLAHVLKEHLPFPTVQTISSGTLVESWYGFPYLVYGAPHPGGKPNGALLVSLGGRICLPTDKVW